MEDTQNFDPYFFENVLENVRQIPIEDIVYDMYQVPIGLCPFHNDRHAGSFSLHKKYNYFHCFSCGEKGDGIRFVQLKENISFPRAVWKLAIQFNIVTIQQMKDFLNGELIDAEVKRPPRVYDDVFIDKENVEIANIEVLHNVFSVFAEGESLIKKNQKLSKKHHEYLKKVRKLSNEEIKRAGYFSIPNRSKYWMNVFLNELKERFGYEENVLENVPGFYFLDKVGSMTFVSYKGIGIPIKNERQQIVGIQVRLDETNLSGMRYVWFSSSFANEKDGMSKGTGSGSPIHISYPKHNRHPEDIYITEGVFKSEQLAKYFQAISVSLQGVQSWRGKVNQLINFLEEEKGQPIRRIHIFFDADVSENVFVYTAFREMYESLKEEFPNLQFSYYWWKKRYGKGIDDLLLNQLGRLIKKIDCKTYVEAYDKLINNLQELYGVEKQKLDKEIIAIEYEKKIGPLFSRI